MPINALWVSASVGYVLCNVDESTALTRANSVSVRCSVGRIVIASEIRQENKIIIFLVYNTMKTKKQSQDQGCNGFI